MSAYEELVERCSRKAVCGQMQNGKPLWVFLADNNKTAGDLCSPIRAVLAEVARTLENHARNLDGGQLYLTIYSYLRASPLFPPDKEPPR